MGSTASITGSAGNYLGIAGAATSAVGAYSAAQLAGEAYAFQASVANANADYEQKRAEDAIARGVTAESYQRLKTAQFKSAQRARLGASGVDLNTGSAAAVQQSTDILGEIDALTVRENASREAAGLIRMRNNSIYDAAGYGIKGAAESPFGSAAGTFLTSASSLARNWYSPNRTTGPY